MSGLGYAERNLPLFFANSFSPLDLFKADCEAEELVQELHLVSLMKDTALEKDTQHQVYQEYVMNLPLRPSQKKDSSLSIDDLPFGTVMTKLKLFHVVE